MLSAANPDIGRRLLVGAGLVLTLIAVLVGRLWYLQGIQGAYYRDLSENNRTRTIRSLASRGRILDREGRVLVTNRPSFSVDLMLEDTPDVDATLRALSDLTGEDVEVMKTRLHSQDLRRHFEPKTVIPDVARDILARVKAQLYRLPGVIVSAVPTRSYPNGSLGSQILGYSREISHLQLERDGGRKYRRGDILGQSGIEKQWDDHLRGVNGAVQVEVDARGYRRSELGIVDSISGGDLYLTIDLDLEATAQKALEGKKGAIIMLDAQTGEVLAMVSSPTFDANIFSGKMDLNDWNSVVNGKGRPLMNRAIANAFPPGSTFKLIASLAGLAEKKITLQSTVYCPGYFLFAGRPYHCHSRTGHGLIDLTQAVAKSCNTFFYHLGQDLGIEGLNKYGALLNLGSLTKIGLPGEKSGTLPSEAWKLAKLGERWYPGDTIPVSIGQGYLTVTPLQLLVAITAIANDGKVFRPGLVKRVVASDQSTEREFEPKVIRQLDIDPKNFAIVRSLAAGVVNTEGGTGKRAQLPGITVGGKTGTAQVTALGRGGGHELLRDHAWFVAFAPVEKPMVSIVVLVENAGLGGGVAAAPLARDVMAVYFKKKGMLPEDLVLPSYPDTVAPAPIVASAQSGTDSAHEAKARHHAAEVPAQASVPVAEPNDEGAPD